MPAARKAERAPCLSAACHIRTCFTPPTIPPTSPALPLPAQTYGASEEDVKKFAQDTNPHHILNRHRNKEGLKEHPEIQRFLNWKAKHKVRAARAGWRRRPALRMHAEDSSMHACMCT